MASFLDILFPGYDQRDHTRKARLFVPPCENFKSMSRSALADHRTTSAVVPLRLDSAKISHVTKHTSAPQGVARVTAKRVSAATTARDARLRTWPTEGTVWSAVPRDSTMQPTPKNA